MNFLVVGPSCIGKSTLVNKCAKFGYNHVKSYTTRPKREDDTDYIFVTDEEFNSFDDFIDKSIHLGYQYGIRKSSFAPINNILTTNMEGIENLKDHVDGIIILSPMYNEDLYDRIMQLRPDGEQRVELAKKEIEYYDSLKSDAKCYLKSDPKYYFWYVSKIEDLDYIAKSYNYAMDIPD